MVPVKPSRCIIAAGAPCEEFAGAQRNGSEDASLAMDGPEFTGTKQIPFRFRFLHTKCIVSQTKIPNREGGRCKNLLRND